MGNKEHHAMNPSSVSYLPHWKQGATAEERLFELMQIAQKHPERFDSMIVVYNEQLPNNRFRVRYITSGKEGSMHFLGLLELAKTKLYEWISGEGE